MVTSTITEAQSQLAKLIGLAEQGEEVIIADAGKPLARLVPFRTPSGAREGGQWQGQIKIAPDFDELPPQVGEALGIPPS